MSIKIHSRAAWAAASLTAVAAISTLIYAQSAPPGLAPAAPAPMDLSTVKPEDAKAYFTTYGWIIGQRTGIKQLGLTADEIDQINAGIKLALTSGPRDIPGGEGILPKMQDYLQARAEKVAKEEIAKQKTASDKLFADLDKNPNVKKTATGLYYEIVTPGTDPKPTDTDTVTVKYKGTLTDGTVFDQTDDKDPTRDFPVAGVIPGWTEGLKLIGKGGTIKLYIPAKLAYGENPESPVIPPGAALIFETSIVDIKATKADPSAMQITPEMLKAMGGGSAPSP